MKYKLNEQHSKELKEALKNKENQKWYRKIQAVLLQAEGNSYDKIANVTKLSQRTIGRAVQTYATRGIEGLLVENRKSNNYYMTFTQEKEFLEQFIDKATKGQVITVNDMLIEYRKETGKKMTEPAFYRLLKRHGWRKLMPRPRHPKKADAETIEASKKLTKK